jgi:multidrug efflux pump subunit AcrB
MQEGLPRLEAAVTGAREVAWPITTSTLTTVCAFVPLIFWPDTMGDFMSFLPKTVIVALSASLLVGLVINPVFCAAFMKARPHGKRARRHRFTEAYERVLRAALAHRGLTLGVAASLLVTLVVAFARFGAGIELFPDVEPRRATVDVRCAEGSRLATTDALCLEIGRRIDRLPGRPDIKFLSASVGSQGGMNPLAGGEAAMNLGQIHVEFLERKERNRSSTETLADIRNAVADIADARIEVQKEKHGPPTGAPITIRIAGEHFDRLAPLLQRVKAAVRTVPGVVDLKDDYVASRPELQFRVDRHRAGLMNVSTGQIGAFLHLCVNGYEAGKYREGDEEYDILIRLAPRWRYDREKLRQLFLPGPEGRMIPLASLVTPLPAGGYGKINRLDHQRVITVEANNAEGTNANAVLQAVKERLRPLAREAAAAGYAISYAGEDEEREKAAAFLRKAFLIALFLILLVLVTQFNALGLSVIILAAVLLSFVGVFGVLLAADMPFGIIMTGVGVISLAGVVVNNGIVLVDYTERLRERGLAIHDAVVQAARTRLRPVLLTAVTTIMGLLPMALGVSFDFRAFVFDVNNESSQWWGPMALVVISGLAFATVLTLVVTPAMYMMVRGRAAPGTPASPPAAVRSLVEGRTKPL